MFETTTWKQIPYPFLGTITRAHQAPHQSLFGGEKSLGDGLLPWFSRSWKGVFWRFIGLWTSHFFRFILGFWRIWWICLKWVPKNICKILSVTMGNAGFIWISYEKVKSWWSPASWDGEHPEKLAKNHQPSSSNTSLLRFSPAWPSQKSRPNGTSFIFIQWSFHFICF